MTTDVVKTISSLSTSVIEEPKIIDSIIGHLKLTFEAERPPPPHNALQELLMAAEERREYFWCLLFCSFLLISLILDFSFQFSSSACFS